MPGEVRERIEEGRLVGPAVDLLHEAAVSLDEIRRQPGHLREAGHPGAEVIHGHAQAGVAQPLGMVLQCLEIIHALGFRELHHDAFHGEGQGLQPARKATPESRRLQADGFKIHEVQVVSIPALGQSREGGFKEAQVQSQPILGCQGGVLQDRPHRAGDARLILELREVFLGHHAIVPQAVHGLHMRDDGALAVQ